jgi:hypothetical protein
MSHDALLILKKLAKAGQGSRALIVKFWLNTNLRISAFLPLGKTTVSKTYFFYKVY